MRNIHTMTLYELEQSRDASRRILRRMRKAGQQKTQEYKVRLWWAGEVRSEIKLRGGQEDGDMEPGIPAGCDTDNRGLRTPIRQSS